jgi:hypothetical protein
MNMPYGICAGGTRLTVADAVNSRLISFERDGLAIDVGATRLAGQASFEAKGDNRWRPATRDSLRLPYGVAPSGDTLAIAESDNNRVLLWDLAA